MKVQGALLLHKIDANQFSLHCVTVGIQPSSLPDVSYNALKQIAIFDPHSPFRLFLDTPAQ